MQMAVLIGLVLAQRNGLNVPPVCWILLSLWTAAWVIGAMLQTSENDD